MKFVMQIAVGVFLGSLGAQVTMDVWRAHQENRLKEAADKLRAEQEKVRLEQGERIRALLMQGRQGKDSAATRPPAGFVPDDDPGQ